MKRSLTVFIVSDATGTTAESVLTSVLVHYKKSRFIIKRFPFTRTKKAIDDLISKTPRGRCLLVYTFVSTQLRRYLARKANDKKLIAVDVMGPILKRVSDLMEHTPELKPGAYRHQEEENFHLVEAINFTMQHDDGQGLDTLDQADLIILGVSRSGKTPTSIYLSCRNLKVANIPIILDVPFPREYARIKKPKVGLLIDFERLIQLRSERADRLSGMETSSYSSRSHIIHELDYCDKVYRKIPLLYTINVTHRSVEEISEWITRQVLG